MLTISDVDTPVEDARPADGEWTEARRKALRRRRRLGNPAPLVPGSAVARVLLAAWQGDKEWHELDSLADLAAVITHLSVRAHAGGNVRVLGHSLLADLAAELRLCGLHHTTDPDEWWTVWGDYWIVYDPADDPANDPQHPAADVDDGPATDATEFAGCGAFVAAGQILFHGPVNGLGDPPIDVILAAM